MAISSAATDEQYPVHIGAWTNWSRGKVMGATLTLRRQDADLLIAFTAFFVAYIGTRFWRIICFAVHRTSSTARPQDAVYHQSQAILRNSSSPESGLTLLLGLLWSSRRSQKRLRPLLAATCALLCLAAFGAAGGLSSQISTRVGNEVLIKSAGCASSILSEFDLQSYFTTLPATAERVNNAANYAQQCYSNSSDRTDCDRLVESRLEGMVDMDAPCPFDDQICQSQSGNIRLDTGYVNSHSHLGLNSPEKQRVLWRNVLHCAPLTTDGFTSQEVTPLQNFTRYHLGSQNAPNSSIDYVHKAPSLESQYSSVFADDIAVSHNAYSLTVFEAPMQNGTLVENEAAFRPIPLIARDDADIVLIFLSGNGVTYFYPTSDEWYATAETPLSVGVGTGDSTESMALYLPREPASPLGCTNRYQFCDTASEGNSGCGPLTSLRDAVAGAAPLFGTTYDDMYAVGSREDADLPEPTARLSYIADIFFGGGRTITSILRNLGPMALLSQKTLFNGCQGPLPSNQWQLDISHLWNITLASAQATVVDTASTTDPELLRLWTEYTSPALTKICNSQKIKSTAYGSFSLFGLYCILVSGLLIVLISYLLEPLSSVILKRYGHHRHQHLEWTANSTLQLQRLAHEGLGLGTWSKCTDDIPTTKPDELLGCLDTTDPKHPFISVSLKPGNGLSKVHSGIETAVTANLDKAAPCEQTLSLSPTVNEPSTPGSLSQVVTDVPEHGEITSVVVLHETTTAGDPLSADNYSAPSTQVREDGIAAQLADRSPTLVDEAAGGSSELQEPEQAEGRKAGVNLNYGADYKSDS